MVSVCSLRASELICKAPGITTSNIESLVMPIQGV